LGNSQENFQLHGFTMNENIAKSFFLLGLLFWLALYMLWKLLHFFCYACTLYAMCCCRNSDDGNTVGKHNAEKVGFLCNCAFIRLCDWVIL